MKIEIISGSPRLNSITRRVALNLKKWLEDNTDHEVDIIDMKDWNLPAVQTVFVSVDRTPDEFKPLTKRIFEANAFILVTPEYNGSYSPAMKNLLDHFPKQHHKPFGIVTASPGALGGIRASQQLLLLIPAMFGIASPYLLIVPAVDKKFDDQGNLSDASFEKNVHNFISEFIWLAENIVPNDSAVAEELNVRKTALT
ncbi:MAG TPA: NAD(P)H-dependent oxidoreductase [Chitinophagaceae bacterium]|nr:NAD(P)H-dependent oxidoreductase [Chitinophagaceae bacterium]